MAELRLLSADLRTLGGAAALARLVEQVRPDVVAVHGAPSLLRWRSKRAAVARGAGLVVATAHRPGGVVLLTTVATEVRSPQFLGEPPLTVADVVVRSAPWSIGVVASGAASAALIHLDRPHPVVVAGPYDVAADRATVIERQSLALDAGGSEPMLVVLAQAR